MPPARLGRRRGGRAAVRRALAPAGAALPSCSCATRHRRGGRPGRLRRDARPLGRLREPDRALAYLRQAWSTGRGRCCGTGPSSDRHAARERCSRPTPGADDAPLDAGPPRPPCSTRCGRLPRRQREVLALRYYLDLSEAEIADDARHQPRRGQEPRLAGRRRPARPVSAASWRTGHDRLTDDSRTTSVRRAAVRRRRRTSSPDDALDAIRSRPKVTPMSHAPLGRPWPYAAGGIVATAAVIGGIAFAGGDLGFDRPRTTRARPARPQRTGLAHHRGVQRVHRRTDAERRRRSPARRSPCTTSATPPRARGCSASSTGSSGVEPARPAALAC